MRIVESETATPSKALLYAALNEGYAGPVWHGPCLRSVLQGIDCAAAQLRLSQEHNSVWEIVLHLAFARHRALLHLAKLTGRSSARFPRRLRRSWWPELPPDRSSAAWKADRQLLANYQNELLTVLESTSEGVLARPRAGGRPPIGIEILGLAFHDAYHAGQIRLMRTADRGR